MMHLAQIADALFAGLAPLSLAEPVTHVYNPLVYVTDAWDLECERFWQGQNRSDCPE